MPSIQQALLDADATTSAEDAGFFQKNKFGSYDCTLCKVNLLKVENCDSHAKTQMHIKQVAIEVTRKHRESQMDCLPIVLVSVFEHNSNILPWKETGARVFTIPLTEDGDFDY
jgi:hypothetical protein